VTGGAGDGVGKLPGRSPFLLQLSMEKLTNPADQLRQLEQLMDAGLAGDGVGELPGRSPLLHRGVLPGTGIPPIV